MGKYDTTARMVRIEINRIQTEKECSFPSFLLSNAAARLRKAAELNPVPLIVEELKDYKFSLIGNYFTFFAAKEAGLERIWCIVLEEGSDDVELAALLTGESEPKINLTIAKYEDIRDLVSFVFSKYKKEFIKVKESAVIDKLSSVNRKGWKNLEPIKKLGCGLKEEARFNIFSNYFYVTPAQLPPMPKQINLKTATHDQIYDRLKYLHDNEIDSFEKIHVDVAAEKIVSVNKAKWKTFTGITKLDCGITAAKTKGTFSELFSIS